MRTKAPAPYYLPITFALLFAIQFLAAAPADTCKTGQDCLIDARKVLPTQFALGYAEVAARKAKYEGLSEKKRSAKVKDKVAPAVRGPDGAIYITDHHHLARIMIELGKPDIYVNITEDWTGRDVKEFQNYMAAKSKAYLYDENDKLRTFAELPKQISQLKNDPYRSLVYFAQKKDCVPDSGAVYSEFKWAHFFRKHIEKSLIVSDMGKAVREACTWAKDPAHP